VLFRLPAPAVYDGCMPIDLNAPLNVADPEVALQVEHEADRQHDGLEMIASENFVSRAVLEAAGTVFTNKYAEGYPGKRYYGGCEYADVVENIARDRVKRLFGAEHANVQPHSGSQANAAAYMTLIQPGDTILGLDLAHGGHLTHGHKLNFSGKLYNVAAYKVRQDTEVIDYDALEQQAIDVKPKLIIGGGSAYPRQFDFARMRQIADKVGAYLLVDMAHFAGLVAGGAHPSPVPHAHVVTTTTHKTLRGPRSGLILCQQQFAAGIDRSVFPGQQGGPLMHVIAGKAVAFGEALQPEFSVYAHQVVANAKVLAEELQAHGFRVISGGTDTHVVLIDVFGWRAGGGDGEGGGMLGSEAENALGDAGITVNKNAIPFDTNPPMKPSGIRIGSPALTTRGMKEPQMKQVAAWIAEALEHRNDAGALKNIRGQVAELAEEFPLYGWLRA
jgi:glycine hydroxymethyltransferase